MSSYLYYPGCSMEGSGRSYRESLEGICEPLGITLEEINDWNCCGATEYVSLSTTPAYAMIARNLAIAAGEKKDGESLVAACSACYLNLAKADHYMGAQPALKARVNDALGAGGLHYDPGTVKVRHLLEVILNDVGLDAVKAAVKKPLTGLKVAPYLGCMVPRPDIDGAYTNHEQPNDLDRLLRALGAEVVDYPLKTECCGGHMTQVAPKVGLELIRRLIAEAERREAVMMVTVCPMCQINIDAYQGEMNAMFHTQLQDADRVLHPADGRGLRHGAQEGRRGARVHERQQGPGDGPQGGPRAGAGGRRSRSSRAQAQARQAGPADAADGRQRG